MQAEIKKAFRKLALKLHPDKNPGDEVTEAADIAALLRLGCAPQAFSALQHVQEASAKFQSLQRIYSVLSDPERSDHKSSDAQLCGRNFFCTPTAVSIIHWSDSCPCHRQICPRHAGPMKRPPQSGSNVRQYHDNILHLPCRRKVYDQTGDLSNAEELTGENFDDLYNFYRDLYKEVTEADIDQLASQFRGSDEEAAEVLQYYERFQGDMPQV